ncbi:HAMP domain-containing protein [Pigmentiphaga aceris]|uniref:HAMP domain-containing protein n=1 Tax=Pigmentiphaga aceris TaxID=1940612 RepID=A0A5C0B3S0_9BURK|nr:methyl-accepting chemotaxis protein [Pigmentiphaga aceris]QEI08313.1 HAMP domain-containing protein [Pigmentiphaga aceris]
MAYINRVLENISVRTKLLLGFGLVLVLTLAISITGWWSITSLGVRGERMLDIATLNDLARDMRIARLSYTLTASTADANSVTEQLGKLDSHLAHSRSVFTSELSVPQLKQASEAVRRYRQDYADLVEGIKGREAARPAFTKHADTATAELQTLANRIASQDRSQGERDAITRAQSLLVQARAQVGEYAYTLNPEFEPLARAAIQQSGVSVRALDKLLVPSEPESVQAVQKSLDAFREVFGQFGDAQAAVEVTQFALDADMEKLFAASQRLAQIQAQERADDEQRAHGLLAVATGVVLLLGVLAALGITRMIVRPLMATLQRAEQVANGDLSHDVVVTRRDELGMLQASMQRMTLNLRDLIGGLRDGVVQLASSAEQLSAVTAQTSSGVNGQQQETDQLATAMGEMTAAVHEVARSAERASDAAVHANREAGEGNEVVVQAIGQIERLANEVVQSTVAMTDLKRESEKIGSVLDVIKAVAQQTNLLALNAAIEAARAGEAGRGFAVVADEVRSLAQRAKDSTEEIEQLIAGLQRGTLQVASSLESSRALTDSSVELARRAGVSLGSITRSVSTIESMNHQIATAAEQQSSVTEGINRSVTTVREISEQTSAASQETATSSVKLAQLGAHLQTMVGRFTF